MTLKYVIKLGLKICSTNVRAQKIDSFALKTFRMILTSFEVEDKLGWARFFQETFLFTNINLEMVLSIFFFTFSNRNI